MKKGFKKTEEDEVLADTSFLDDAAYRKNIENLLSKIKENYSAAKAKKSQTDNPKELQGLDEELKHFENLYADTIAMLKNKRQVYFVEYTERLSSYNILKGVYEKVNKLVFFPVIDNDDIERLNKCKRQVAEAKSMVEWADKIIEAYEACQDSETEKI